MPDGRDVLKAMGAGLGLTGLSAAGLTYRALFIDQRLRYALGEAGPDVEAPLARLEGDAGPTVVQQEGPFYFPSSPRRRYLRVEARGPVAERPPFAAARERARRLLGVPVPDVQLPILMGLHPAFLDTLSQETPVPWFAVPLVVIFAGAVPVLIARSALREE